MVNSRLSRSAVGVLISAVMLGCAGPAAREGALEPPQTVGLARPQREGGFVEVLPPYSTVGLGQNITLHDEVGWVCGYMNICWKHEPATWSSSGGSLKVHRGHRQATFSASTPGVYTVYAKYHLSTGSASVTVTSP